MTRADRLRRRRDRRSHIVVNTLVAASGLLLVSVAMLIGICFLLVLR